MKHNDMRGEDEERNYNKRVASYPVSPEGWVDHGVVLDTPTPDYKLRYEQAMNILGTIYNPHAWDGSITEIEFIHRIAALLPRYEKLEKLDKD